MKKWIFSILAGITGIVAGLWFSENFMISKLFLGGIEVDLSDATAVEWALANPTKSEWLGATALGATALAAAVAAAGDATVSRILFSSGNHQPCGLGYYKVKRNRAISCGKQPMSNQESTTYGQSGDLCPTHGPLI